MLFELFARFFKPVATFERLPILELFPQRADHPMALFGKIVQSLALLANRAPRGGIIYDEAGVPRRVLRAFLDVAQSTTGELVALQAGMRVRVISLVAMAGGTATTATLKSAATAIAGVLSNAANGGEVLPRNVDGWFQTAVGEALNVTTGAGSSTGFTLNYILVPDYHFLEDGTVAMNEDGTPQVLEAA